MTELGLGEQAARGQREDRFQRLLGIVVPFVLPFRNGSVVSESNLVAGDRERPVIQGIPTMRQYRRQDA